MKKWLSQKKALVLVIVIFMSLLAVGLYLMPEEGYDKVRKDQQEYRQQQKEQNTEKE